MLAEALQANGWTARTQCGSFTKGDWELDFDTSHWLIVSSKNNPRVFDVPLPGEYETPWIVSLIEHLCRMEDERVRLRKALEAIRDMPGAGASARSAAADALERCYHRWLINLDVPEGRIGRLYCPICGQLADEPKQA